MANFINENDFTVYVITSELDGKHYGMVATWICTASLRTDELRFTLPLSKFNDSTKAILGKKSFILHKLPKSRFKTAFTMGSCHSLSVDKFANEAYGLHPSGARILNSSSAYGEAKVISHIEAEDRYILYCSLNQIQTINDNEPPLTQKELFSQLSPSERETLGSKYLADSQRDTPKK